MIRFALSSYLIYYRFKLFSNFTYFLDDPAERRRVRPSATSASPGAHGPMTKDASTVELLGTDVGFTVQAGCETRLDRDHGRRTRPHRRPGSVLSTDPAKTTCHEWSRARSSAESHLERPSIG